ncbi:MAG: hypothetical protein ACI8Z1_000744 [Candidatus Azotimanducaceae bacterium]
MVRDARAEVDRLSLDLQGLSIATLETTATDLYNLSQYFAVRNSADAATHFAYGIDA